MRRARRLIALAVAAVALTFAACGEGDDDETSTNPVPSKAPGEVAPSGVSALPPEFVECMANEGYEVESSADIHSAPPEVLQQCFGSGH